MQVATSGIESSRNLYGCLSRPNAWKLCAFPIETENLQLQGWSYTRVAGEVARQIAFYLQDVRHGKNSVLDRGKRSGAALVQLGRDARCVLSPAETLCKHKSDTNSKHTKVGQAPRKLCIFTLERKPRAPHAHLTATLRLLNK